MKIMNSTSQAPEVCEPKNRDQRPSLAGLLRKRMTAKTTMPTRTRTANRSSRKRTIGQVPMIGNAKPAKNSSPNASTTVRVRIRKPKNTNTCAMPGTVHLSSFLWPSTSVASTCTRAPTWSVRP